MTTRRVTTCILTMGSRSDPDNDAVCLRRAHLLCQDYGDVASASLIENGIDEAEHHVWFLYEATRRD